MGDEFQLFDGQERAVAAVEVGDADVPHGDGEREGIDPYRSERDRRVDRVGKLAFEHAPQHGGRQGGDERDPQRAQDRGGEQADARATGEAAALAPGLVFFGLFDERGDRRGPAGGLVRAAALGALF